MPPPNPTRDVLGVPFGDDYNHRHEREQLGFRESSWLRAKGWEHTCETPGSYWLWRKVLEAPRARGKNQPGTVILVDQDMALTMQQHMDSLEADLAAPAEEVEAE